MRAVKLLAATVSVVTGAYLLLIANGISVAMQERTQGWNITPLPPHPVARIVTYLSVAIGVQFAAGWLLMPPATKRGIPRFWSRYAARVALCIGGCFIVAFVLAFVVQALLDAGTI
jgi:hypothetical protein